jgi:serine/threonine-protein kinase
MDKTQLVEQSSDPLIGGELDRYRILEAIGTGGLGRVYRAEHAFIDRRYAIKVLYGDFSLDPKFQERFRREANSASKIHHPNVVRVEDFGTTRAGLTFLAMELLEGQTLDGAIKRGKLSPERAANIARQVLSGLDAAHELGFVHRDVKPQNVMLINDPNGELVKILDFGAVAMRKVETDKRLTGVGDLIGTPAYMAPEQCEDATVGPTADLYAVGAILYEMLTGSTPYEGRGRAELLIKHLMQPPPLAPPSLGLERIVAELLKKEPDERPQSAAAVIAMIDELGLDLASTGDLLPMIGGSEVQLLRSESDEFESNTVRSEVENFDDPTVPPPIETARTRELDVSEFEQEIVTHTLSVREPLLQRWLASVRAWLRSAATKK